MANRLGAAERKVSMRHLLLAICICCCSALPMPLSAETSGRQVASRCNAIEGWQEQRDQLGGTYLQDGWESGFLSVLRITAIGGQIQGNLQILEYVPDESYDRSTIAVTGLFDDEQISLNFDFGFGGITAIGTWSADGMQVSWPDSYGAMAGAWFQPVREAVVEKVLDVWPQHDARSINADLALASMERVAMASPYEIFGPERVLAANAASYLGFPFPDPLNLLLTGWVSAVQYSEHDPELSPNQANWYTIHTFSYPAEAYLAADCVQQMWMPEWDEEELELPHGAIAIVRISAPGEFGEMSEMIAIHGSNLIVVSTYGGEAMVAQGIGTLTAIVSEIGEIR
jgi:hypothetical protein